MSHPSNNSIQQNHKINTKTSISSSKNKCHKCHKCSTLISVHPVKNDNNNNNNINNNNPPQIAKQCVYVDCSLRSKNLFECERCSELSLCRNCNMTLCKLCRINLKVLSCAYCNSYICSQQCYTSLLKKYFQCLENFGISIHAHQSMHFFRKLLLPPHLHAAIANINDENLPFHVCENCKVQNCGCVDWLSCVNCRKYYCVDCEDNVLKKCGLEDCQSYTCCHKQEWNAKCDYCNRFGNCGLIFCTKGHCNRHIIINREIGYDEINNPNKDNQDKKDNNVEDCDDDNNNDNDDINLTAQ